MPHDLDYGVFSHRHIKEFVKTNFTTNFLLNINLIKKTKELLV